MNTVEQTNNSTWLERVASNKTLLTQFITDYHPASKGFGSTKALPITAPTTELACQVVRAKIAEETSNDPIELFNQAIEKGEIIIIYQILEAAWFGVPESTSCWNIPGFSLAVDLLDTPPDPLDQEGENIG